MTFEELKAKFVGKMEEPAIFEVEKGSAKRYAVATNDLNPLYLDEDAAARSTYGVTLAPPGFFGWPVKQPTPQMSPLQRDMMDGLAEAGFPDILDGGTDFEFFLPIRAGDILVNSKRCADLFSRSGARKMAFMVIENNFTNQNGQPVVRMKQTVIALSKVEAPKAQEG